MKKSSHVIQMEPEHNLNYPYKREAGGGVVVETEEEKVT
jgi:hypothetical protein